MVTLILMGHGELRGELYQFRLVGSPQCKCKGSSETITHLLYRCKRVVRERAELERVVEVAGFKWPMEGGEVLHSRQVYERLRTFARGAFLNRSDRGA